mmetsp:Transcript_22360/g.37389  ORF Transcript_22360/g.37389 Transcript_22360/m.37389 type:complete len:223 (-) Transcript_22360:817-1485(-)
MLVHAAGEGHLLALGGADGGGELQLGEIGLDRQHACTRGHGPDVKHQDLALRELLHLASLLVTLSADTEEATQQEEVHLKLAVHLRELAYLTQHLPNETIRAGERRVHSGADTDEPPGHRELQRVLLREERHDAAEDRRHLHLALRVLADDARPHLHLLPDPQHPLEDGPPSHPALDVVNLRARLVHIEGPDHDHVGRRGEVPHGDRDLVADILAHHVDVVF